jgi:hypothetical protein
MQNAKRAGVGAQQIQGVILGGPSVNDCGQLVFNSETKLQVERFALPGSNIRLGAMHIV